MEKPAELYHGRRYGKGAELDWLDPTTAEEQERNGRVGKFLYATHRLDQAVLYALPFPGVAGSFIDTLDGSPDEVLIRFDARPGAAARAPIEAALVHAVSSEGFEQVWRNPREWIRDTGAKAWTKARVAGLDDVLAAGVQYLTLAPGRDAEDARLFLESSRAAGATTRAAVAESIAGKNPVFVWENERSGLGMDSALASRVASLRAASALGRGSICAKLAAKRQGLSPSGPAAGASAPSQRP